MTKSIELPIPRDNVAETSANMSWINMQKKFWVIVRTNSGSIPFATIQQLFYR